MIALALVLKCFGERNMILHDPMRNKAAALSHGDAVQHICGVTVNFIKGN